jgi:acid phosphatase
MMLALALVGCTHHKVEGPTPSPAAVPAVSTDPLADKIQTIVVIYAENRSFDNLYGTFPGAEGIPASGVPKQVDRDGKPLDRLYPTWGGVNDAIPEGKTRDLPNQPYSLEKTYPGLTSKVITRDLVHRFFQNQMQIDGGKNDAFAAWSDGGGLSLGYYDGYDSAMWAIAKQSVLADHFFMGAFGGSFLNHQYLVCACAPVVKDKPGAAPSVATLDSKDGKMIPVLTLKAKDETKPPQYVSDGDLAPAGYFDEWPHAVNTMAPPYQPSFVAAKADKQYADPEDKKTLPPQIADTIATQLDGKGVAWKWYSGAWNETVKASMGDRKFGDPVPDFQFHHQPFNYYAAFDAGAHAEYRASHLKDYDDLVADAAAGSLPAVAFYKPQGNFNQHAGYAEIAAGDAHIAELIGKLKASPQWAHMLVVVTYDENGGWWDHVAPPAGDALGPGTRIPALVISPFAKPGFVDHTPYDTGSIARLIERRFGLPPLPGIAARDAGLVAHGNPKMGDLTGGLDLH